MEPPNKGISINAQFHLINLLRKEPSKKNQLTFAVGVGGIDSLSCPRIVANIMPNRIK
jgi:hypothetical protein